jgi:tetratricopeptide (TPR) repeat protein
MNQPLRPPDRLHLQAAQAWAQIGNHAEASAELDKITPELRAHPDVLEVRRAAHALAKEPEASADFAGANARLDQDWPGTWIHLSFALHELKRTQEAFNHLLSVADKFPLVWTIPYDLACYCAQLGRLEECKEWFKRAMTIDEWIVRRLAADDPDLKPLWDSASGALWKPAE